MVIVPVTWPAESAAALAVTVTVDGAVPLVALTLSHGSDSASVHVTVPVPVFVIVRFCVGATAPATAAKVMDAGLTLSVGPGATPVNSCHPMSIAVPWGRDVPKKSSMTMAPTPEPEVPRSRATVLLDESFRKSEALEVRDRKLGF